MEEDRTPVGRLDFKSSEGRTTSLVGSTPTLFRQSHLSNPIVIGILIFQFIKSRQITDLELEQPVFHRAFWRD
jgi:hypothetical protein